MVLTCCFDARGTNRSLIPGRIFLGGGKFQVFLFHQSIFSISSSDNFRVVLLFQASLSCFLLSHTAIYLSHIPSTRKIEKMYSIYSQGHQVWGPIFLNFHFLDFPDNSAPKAKSWNVHRAQTSGHLFSGSRILLSSLKGFIFRTLPPQTYFTLPQSKTETSV